MNMFLLPSSERIMAWRAFRKSIENKTEIEQLQEVARWGATAPTCNYILDPFLPDSWPTPWELMLKGDLDATAIAYLMEQTLLAVGWDHNRVKLAVLQDLKRKNNIVVVVVDDSYVLNYSFSEVFNFDKAMSYCAYLAIYRPNEEGGHDIQHI